VEEKNMNTSNRSSSQALALPRPKFELSVLIDGIYAGAIGAALFALYFLAVDVWRSEALATPALVGAAVLQGASPLAPVPVDLGLVGAFSLVHAALFAGFGVVVSCVVSRMRELPALPLLAIGCFLALQSGFLAATALLAPGLGAAIGHGWVAAGNALAAAAIAVWLRSAYSGA
jgi:hypothetical protein